MSEGEDRATGNGPVLSHVSVGTVDVSLCESCQWAAEGMDWHALDPAPDCEPLALLAESEVITGLDPEAGAYFSWQDCDGCGALPGMRLAYRARPVSQ